jgi:uncharacterized membrane protein
MGQFPTYFKTRTALFQTLLFTTLFVLMVSFRERELGNDSVDWQVALRLAFLGISMMISCFAYKAWLGRILIRENFLLIPFFSLLFFFRACMHQACHIARDALFHCYRYFFFCFPVIASLVKKKQFQPLSLYAALSLFCL